MKFENKFILIIIIASLALLFTCVYFESNNNNIVPNKDIENKTNDKETNDRTYILHYKNNIYSYDIIYEKGQDRRVYIIQYEEVDCYTLPCNPIRIDEYDKKVDKSSLAVFKGLFNDNELEKTVHSMNLSEYQNKTLENIINKDTNTVNSKYNVTYSSSQSNITKKGYYISEEDDKTVTVYVSAGPKSNSGYGIEVYKVEFIYDDVYIYVLEKEPKPNETTMQVITYPTAKIELFEKPKSIRVFDDKDTEYELVK